MYLQVKVSVKPGCIIEIRHGRSPGSVSRFFGKSRICRRCCRASAGPRPREPRAPHRSSFPTRSRRCGAQETGQRVAGVAAGRAESPSGVRLPATPRCRTRAGWHGPSRQLPVSGGARFFSSAYVKERCADCRTNLSRLPSLTDFWGTAIITVAFPGGDAIHFHPDVCRQTGCLPDKNAPAWGCRSGRVPTTSPEHEHGRKVGEESSLVWRSRIRYPGWPVFSSPLPSNYPHLAAALLAYPLPGPMCIATHRHGTDLPGSRE